jgi:hypothetical protein
LVLYPERKEAEKREKSLKKEEEKKEKGVD